MSKGSYKKMMTSFSRINNLKPEYRKFITGQPSSEYSDGRQITMAKQRKDTATNSIILTERRVVNVHSSCRDTEEKIAETYNCVLLK